VQKHIPISIDFIYEKYKNQNRELCREVQDINLRSTYFGPSKYKHLSEMYRKNKIILSSARKFKILDAEKYDHSTRAVHTLNIGSRRNPRKIQMLK
jgi:hypothetical protein